LVKPTHFGKRKELFSVVRFASLGICYRSGPPTRRYEVAGRCSKGMAWRVERNLSPQTGASFRLLAQFWHLRFSFFAEMGLLGTDPAARMRGKLSTSCSFFWVERAAASKIIRIWLTPIPEGVWQRRPRPAEGTNPHSSGLL